MEAHALAHAQSAVQNVIMFLADDFANACFSLRRRKNLRFYWLGIQRENHAKRSLHTIFIKFSSLYDFMTQLCVLRFSMRCHCCCARNVHALCHHLIEFSSTDESSMLGEHLQ